MAWSYSICASRKTNRLAVWSCSSLRRAIGTAPAFVAELVVFGGEGVLFCLVRGVEVIELSHEHVPQRDDDVLDRHGLTDTVRAFGVPSGTVMKYG